MAVETNTYTGAPAGMNVALPAHELADEEARYLQDIILDVPGVLKMRGPITSAPGVLTLNPFKALGMGQAVDPDGNVRLVVVGGLNDTTGTNLCFYSDDYGTVEQHSFTNLFASGNYPIVDIKPMLNGGALISGATGYEQSDTQTTALWRGTNKNIYTTGTITTTQGSTTVTGSGTSWSSEIGPGMFLLRSSVLLGVVKSVDSDTQITLEQGALHNSAGHTYALSPIRGLARRVSTGRITCATDSTDVQGSFTKFQTLLEGTPTNWHLFTLPDLEPIGQVASITDETDLVLSTNAKIALDNAKYVAIPGSSAGYTNAALSSVGFLNAQYAGRQFYANSDDTTDEQSGSLSSRVWFSDTLDPEALDLDPSAGDFLDIGSAQDYDSPIMALAPSYNALLFIKENEVFALYGATPGQWQVRKLHDDGTLCGMSVSSIDGGVIWAGRRGIYYYDGVEVRSLTEDKLGNWYERGVTETFDPTTDRMYSMIDRDHYFLFIDNFDGEGAGVGVTKGGTTTYPTRLTIIINLRTGAVTTATNLNIRGAVELPAEKAMGTLYAINDSVRAQFGLARDLFAEDEGKDVITCDGDTAGPDPYIESKKYDVGDAQRKKLFKQLQMHFRLVGDNLKMDTIVGLNEDGITSSSEWVANSEWENKRIKFLKRSTHFAFRIYRKLTPVVITRLQMGPWALGFKYQRKGRV